MVDLALLRIRSCRQHGGSTLSINRWCLGNAKGAIGRSITANYFLMGWLGDLFSMNKALDQGIAKRGFANTNIRNQLKGSDECNRLS